jgi:hypothetical protein
MTRIWRRPCSRSAAIGRWRFQCAASAAAVALFASACGDANAGRTTRTHAGVGRSHRPVASQDFDRMRFDRPTTIDNRWVPLKPGTQLLFEGRATVGAERISRRVITTVTDLTKVIDGVRSVVIYERDYDDGQLVEPELAFHAQDRDGNVWNLGEYPEEYDEGKLEGAPDTWIAGLAGARAGILMRAHPQLGTPSYLQGLAPAIEFADRARVYRMGEKTCVPAACYEDVLVTEEWDPVEPGTQRKFYAAGVGNIRVGFHAGKENENLALIKISHLSPQALGRIRKSALQMDRRAYTVRKSLYGRTAPAERLRRM